MAVAGVLAFIYLPTLNWLLGFWWVDRFYSHGPLVAAVCVWFAWRERESVAALPARPNLWGLPLLVGGILAEMAGAVSDVMTLSALSVSPVLAGLVLLTKGTQALRRLAFPLIYFLFAVPILSTISDASGRVLNSMMEWAAAATASATGLFGLQPHRSGTIIYYPTYTLQVVAPCSGMASLVSLMALAALLGHITQTRPARTALLVGAAVPIALVGNVARLMLTALLGVTCGGKIANSFLHDLSGVFAFLLGAGMLVLIPRGKPCP